MEGSRIAYDNRMKLDVEKLSTIPRNPDFNYFFYQMQILLGSLLSALRRMNNYMHVLFVMFTITNIDKYLHKVLSNDR